MEGRDAFPKATVTPNSIQALFTWTVGLCRIPLLTWMAVFGTVLSFRLSCAFLQGTVEIRSQDLGIVECDMSLFSLSRNSPRCRLYKSFARLVGS